MNIQKEINEYIKLNLFDKLNILFNSNFYIYEDNKLINYKIYNKKFNLYDEINKIKKYVDLDTLNKNDIEYKKSLLVGSDYIPKILESRFKNNMPILSIIMKENNEVGLFIYQEKETNIFNNNFKYKSIYEDDEIEDLLKFVSVFHDLMFYIHYDFDENNFKIYDMIKYGEEKNFPNVDIELSDIEKFIEINKFDKIVNYFKQKYKDFDDYCEYREYKNENDEKYKILKEKFNYKSEINILLDEYYKLNDEILVLEEDKENEELENEYEPNKLFKLYYDSLNIEDRNKSVLNNFKNELDKITLADIYNKEKDWDEIEKINDYIENLYDNLKKQKKQEQNEKKKNHILNLEKLYELNKKISKKDELISKKENMINFNFNYAKKHKEFIEEKEIKTKFDEKFDKILSMSFISGNTIHITCFTIISIILIDSFFQMVKNIINYKNILNIYSNLQEYFIYSINKLNNIYLYNDLNTIKNKYTFKYILNTINFTGTILRYDGDCQLNTIASISLQKYSNYKILNEWLYFENLNYLLLNNLEKINFMSSLEDKTMKDIFNTDETFYLANLKSLRMISNLMKMKMQLILNVIINEKHIREDLTSKINIFTEKENIDTNENGFYNSGKIGHAFIKYIENEEKFIRIYKIDLNSIGKIKIVYIYKNIEDVKYIKHDLIYKDIIYVKCIEKNKQYIIKINDEIDYEIKIDYNYINYFSYENTLIYKKDKIYKNFIFKNGFTLKIEKYEEFFNDMIQNYIFNAYEIINENYVKYKNFDELIKIINNENDTENYIVIYLNHLKGLYEDKYSNNTKFDYILPSKINYKKEDLKFEGGFDINFIIKMIFITLIIILIIIIIKNIINKTNLFKKEL